jgi:hypothetical protein
MDLLPNVVKGGSGTAAMAAGIRHKARNGALILKYRNLTPIECHANSKTRPKLGRMSQQPWTFQPRPLSPPPDTWAVQYRANSIILACALRRSSGCSNDSLTFHTKGIGGRYASRFSNDAGSTSHPFSPKVYTLYRKDRGSKAMK